MSRNFSLHTHFKGKGPFIFYKIEGGGGGLVGLGGGH